MEESPFDENKITQRIVQYFDDPKESSALAKVRNISNKAKNKSSNNLIKINSDENINEINTEYNTNINRNLLKEKFQRRKFQFATQMYKHKNSNKSLIDEIKEKKGIKNLDENHFGNEDDNVNIMLMNKSNKNNGQKKVNFVINKTNQQSEINNDTETNTDNKNLFINKKRKNSLDDSDKITQRIVQYFDDPKESSALAKVRNISNKAKNKTSTNLTHINMDNIPQTAISQKFKRREFQFATQVYNPKKQNLNLMELLKDIKSDEKNKNKHKIKEDNESERAGSEEDEDSEFNLDNIDKKNINNIDNKNEKENTSNNNTDKIYDNNEYNNHNINKYEIKVNRNPIINNKYNNFKNQKLFEKEKEKEKEPIVNKEQNQEKNQNKSRNIKVENYRKINIEPKKEREKYSSITEKRSLMSNYNNNFRRQIDYPRKIIKYNSIDEEYRKKNNLVIENINSKEKIIKNVYQTNNKDKKHLKTYKTEYVWDKIINRLVEKRIYFDENEKPKSGINNKYSNNTFNPTNKYKKDSNKFEEKEKNINMDKNVINSDKKENNKTNTNDSNDNISGKNKKLPHLYTDGTLRKRRYIIDTKNDNNNSNNNNKSNYRIYQKREIIKKEEEIKPLKSNKPEKNRTEIIENDEKPSYSKEYPKKIEVTKKYEKSDDKKLNKSSEPIINHHFQPEKIEKVEQKYKKIPYSQYTLNKKKNIRLNMYSGENDIFKENEEEMKNRQKNNIYNNYMNNKKTKVIYGRKNKTKNDSDLVEDLEKIEQYSINTYLKNDLLDMYNSIAEEYGDFKSGVFNTNMNNVEEKMGQMDKKKDKNDNNRKKIKYNVNDLCKGKTTTEDIYKKYTKRSIRIKAKVNL